MTRTSGLFYLHHSFRKTVETYTFAHHLTCYSIVIILKGVITMKKLILVLLLNFMAVGSLLGCRQQADENIKDKIKFVPNEEYIGDAHPAVKEEMKLSEDEKAEFKKIKQEILSNKEGE